MGCKVTMSLVSERQDGPIGDDWKYEVEAKVFNEGLKGKGTISVPGMPTRIVRSRSPGAGT